MIFKYEFEDRPVIFKYEFEDGTVLKLLDTGFSNAEVWKLAELHGTYKLVIER